MMTPGREKEQFTESLSKLNNLTYLSIPADFVQCFNQRLLSVQTLSVRGKSNSDILIHWIFPNIRSLYLKDCNLSESMLNVMLSELTCLKLLSISSYRGIIEGIEFPSQLEIVELEDMCINSTLNDLQLSRSGSNNNLKELIMNSCGLRIRHLADTLFPEQLDSLDLTGNNIMDWHELPFSRLQKLRKLIIIRSNKVTNFGLLPQSLESLSVQNFLPANYNSNNDMPEDIEITPPEDLSKDHILCGELPPRLIRLSVNGAGIGRCIHWKTLKLPSLMKHLNIKHITILGSIKFNKAIEIVEFDECRLFRKPITEYERMHSSHSADSSFMSMVYIKLKFSKLFKRKLSELRQLAVTNCDLDTAKFVKKMPNLRRLKLNNNNIKDIRNVIFPYRLTHADFGYNKIQSFSGVKFPIFLEDLGMRSNKLCSTKGLILPATTKKLELQGNNFPDDPNV